MVQFQSNLQSSIFLDFFLQDFLHLYDHHACQAKLYVEKDQLEENNKKLNFLCIKGKLESYSKVVRGLKSSLIKLRSILEGCRVFLRACLCSW